MKNLILVFAVGFTVLGIVIAVFALKSPTNTQVGASSCTQNPKLVLDSTNRYGTLTIYNLKLINNCPDEKGFTLKVSSFPDSPDHYDNWSWKFKNGEWNSAYTTEKLTGTSEIPLTIQVPMDDSGNPENIQPGIYRFFTVETTLADNSGKSDKLELIYNAN